MAGALLSQIGRAQPKRPNIVLIMADDMGFSDLGCYGSEIRTPNIDTLAREGVRFTQFYNTARCCPTRACLLTGLYPQQAGVGHMVDNPKPFPGYRGDLNRESVTLAEVLKQAGYQTMMSGKWHVTPVTKSKHNWPLQRGFDKYYGIIHGAADYFNPVTLVRDNEFVKPDRPDFYFTDAIADNAVQYIEAAAHKPDPFFLYVAFTSPHWPLHALEQDIERYKGRYEEGWDKLREQRHQKQVELNLVDRRWPITPRDENAPAWEDVADKKWNERRMEVYAAQVDRMDQGVGRIVAALRQAGSFEDTLVLVLADNGGCAEELGPKAGGLHIPSKTRSGEDVRVGNVSGVMPGAETTYQSYGLPWANASNTPFRLYKHWVHEGGISSPLIAHWPQRIRNAGAISREPAHLIDIMATFVDVGDAKYPSSYGGHRIQPMEGTSLMPAFQGSRLKRKDALCWEHEGNRAVRQDKWKLVSRYPGEWELYDLEADRTEMTNLASREPKRVKKMAGLYDRWAARARVEPWEKVLKAPKTPVPIPG